MPVKITANQTNTDTGEVSSSVLTAMKDEFKNKAEVIPANGRTQPVIKNYSFYFLKEELMELLNMYPADLGVKIQIGVHTVSTQDVCGNQHIGQLCAIIETYENITTRNNGKAVDEFVLVNGFQSFGTIKILAPNDPVCCPSSDPGGGS
jgi:hypothetical protein